jgi:hypothetical protein
VAVRLRASVEMTVEARLFIGVSESQLPATTKVVVSTIGSQSGLGMPPEKESFSYRYVRYDQRRQKHLVILQVELV